MNHWYLIKILFTASRLQRDERTRVWNRIDYGRIVLRFLELPFYRAAHFSIANYYATALLKGLIND